MGVVIYMLIQLEGLIKTIGILDVFDILIVAFILYRVYKMLRRALEHIGEGGFFKRSMLLNYEEACSLVSELDKAVTKLSSTKTGALIVLERNMGLNDICASGIKIDGIVSAEFLLNVFIPNTPLHDGAAIIRGNRLIVYCHLLMIGH